MKVFSKTALAVALSVSAGSVLAVGSVGASGGGTMSSDTGGMTSPTMDRQSTLDRDEMEQRAERKGDALRDEARDYDGQANASHGSDRSESSAVAGDDGASGAFASDEVSGNTDIDRDNVSGRAAGEGYNSRATADRNSAQARTNADTEEAEE